MELKWDNAELLERINKAPNCTLVELKYLTPRVVRLGIIPPNCTLVELKYGYLNMFCKRVLHSKLYLSGIEIWQQLDFVLGFEVPPNCTLVELKYQV